MLGVRRTSVTLAARALQHARLIKYRRSHLRILDGDGLRESSCECYETVKAHYALLCDVPAPAFLGGPIDQRGVAQRAE
jgi:hypothetical protein